MPCTQMFCRHCRMTLVWMKENYDEYFRLVIDVERLIKMKTGLYAHLIFFIYVLCKRLTTQHLAHRCFAGIVGWPLMVCMDGIELWAIV